MDKTIDKTQGLLPRINVKGVSQESKYSQRKYQGSGQEKKKSLPQEEKVSLSLKEGKDNKDSEQGRKHSKTGSDNRDKPEKLPANVQPRQIDITI